jgi:hypothetical protein
MKFFRAWLVLVLAFSAVLAFAASTAQVLQISNRTGHKVLVFLFSDGQIHTNPNGGVQIASLANGADFNATINANPFALMLLDGSDVWHAEFHDRTAKTIVFTKDTGHATRH